MIMQWENARVSSERPLALVIVKLNKVAKVLANYLARCPQLVKRNVKTTSLDGEYFCRISSCSQETAELFNLVFLHPACLLVVWKFQNVLIASFDGFVWLTSNVRVPRDKISEREARNCVLKISCNTYHCFVLLLQDAVIIYASNFKRSRAESLFYDII